MIRVSDAANTRKTDDAATQRKTTFVKWRKWQRPQTRQLFLKFPTLHLFAGILLLIFCVPFQSHAIVLLGSPGPAPHSPGAPLFLFATRNELCAADPLMHEWRDGNGRYVSLI